MARRVFTQEFKDEAVRLAQTSGKSIKQVADDLGINYNTLLTWRDDAIRRATYQSQPVLKER